MRAMSTEPLNEALDGALLMTGHTNRRQIERARSVFRATRGSEWRTLRLLLAVGELDETGLVVAQEAAIRETMRRALPWTGGQLQFKPNVPPVLRRGLAGLNVEEALIDGMREIDEHSRPLATPQTVVRWAPTPPAGLTAKMIGAVRWQTLSACNGQRTIVEVAESLGRDPALVVDQVQWLLDHGAVLLVPTSPAPKVETGPDTTPMEDRLVLLLSRFETTWPGGRVTRGKAIGALVKMINTVGRVYLEHWQELVYVEARERVWQTLVLSDLAEVMDMWEKPPGLVVRPDRNALRDGQLVPARAQAEIQSAAERDPVATLHALIRLLERALLLIVGEVDRPVATVDSFESVNVFVAELNQRLAALA